MFLRVFKILYSKYVYEFSSSDNFTYFRSSPKLLDKYKIRLKNDEVMISQGNIFDWSRPVFIGEFIDTNSGFKLTGYFRMTWSTRLFFSYWFGFLLLVIISTAIISIMALFVIIFPLVGCAMYYFGYLMLTWSQKNYNQQIEDLVLEMANHKILKIENAT